MSYWSVVIKVPEDQKTKIRLEYVPAMIFFESDSDVKGVAAFSSQDAAQSFREQTARLTTFDVICMALKTVEDVRAWTDILWRYLGPEKYNQLPIYLDPPDAYCKDVRISSDRKNLWTFITKHMPEELHPLGGDIAGFKIEEDRVVTILRDAITKKFAALIYTGPDKIESGVAAVTQFMEDEGTTHERMWKKTDPVDSIFKALADAKAVKV